MNEANNSELLMFYNVENLFLPDPKPLFRGERSKSGLFNWNDYRYRLKLRRIAAVFHFIQQETGKLPMFCGLAEIQGKEVLKDLLAQEIFKNYRFVHYESLDERGIDVALIYDSKKIEILHSEPITYFFKINHAEATAFDTTRDVLYCKIRFQGEVFEVFVLHLPSKRENDINKSKREFILNKISDRISDLIEKSSDRIIVCGDFNENPIVDMLENLTRDKNFNTVLTNPYKKLYLNEKYTTTYHGVGMIFDQMFLSNRFFNENDKLQFKTARIFSSPALVSKDKGRINKPLRTYSGSRYLGGYSDHFPIFCEIGNGL